VLKRSIILKAECLETIVLMNSGKGSFSVKALPAEAQFSPVYASLVRDFDQDGIMDILLGGNQHRAKPQTGIYDAGRALFLKGRGDGSFLPMPAALSGLHVKGEIRDLHILNANGRPYLIIARNNDSFECFNFLSDR